MAVSGAPFTPFSVGQVYTTAQKAETQANIEAFIRKMTHASGDNFPFLQDMPLHTSNALIAELNAFNSLIQTS